MPNLDNAKKALRQSDKRASRNKKQTSDIDNLSRNFRKALESGNVDEAKKLIAALYKQLDKAVSKKSVKKNTASRTKSRMAVRLNKATKTTKK